MYRCAVIRPLCLAFVILAGIAYGCTTPKANDRLAGPNITQPCVDTTSPEDDCGFTLALQESCEPGEMIAVGCSVGCGLGTELCDGWPVLRICAGRKTCTHAGGWRAPEVEQCDTCPFRRIPCPREGSVSVFVRSIAPGDGVNLVCDVQMSRDFVVDITRPCAAPVANDDRLCGFKDRGEIECEPGEQEWIGCGLGCGRGACSGRPILRICDAERGVHCEKEHALPGYGVLRPGTDCEDTCPYGSFECPASGRVRVFEAPEAGEGETSCELVHGVPPIPLTAPCADPSPYNDRECGWHRQGEIPCTPGTKLVAGCSPTCGVGTCSGRAMMRLCDSEREARCSFENSLNSGLASLECDNSNCPFEEDIKCPESGRIVAYWAAEVPEDVLEDRDGDGEVTDCTIAIAPMP